MENPDTLGDLPPPEDAEGRARYFLSLLQLLGQQGTPETLRVREALIEAIETFNTERESDPEGARKNLSQAMLGLEAGVTELLWRGTKKIRDRLMKNARKMGKKSPAGQAMMTAAKGMELVVGAMEMMTKALGSTDPEVRREANAMMNEARQVIDSLRGFAER